MKKGKQITKKADKRARMKAGLQAKGRYGREEVRKESKGKGGQESRQTCKKERMGDRCGRKKEVRHRSEKDRRVSEKTGKQE